jgi:hypothetical protein
MLWSGGHERHELALHLHHLRGVGFIAILSDARAGKTTKQDEHSVTVQSRHADPFRLQAGYDLAVRGRGKASSIQERLALMQTRRP